ncbi:MAG: PTS glucitol/sorbitol transporter subunit IIA [Chloroflexota bacterium]
MIKYECTVVNIGPLVGEFIDAGVIVLFGAGAPEELVDFSIIHDGTELKSDLIPGDTVWIDETSFKVLAVGDVANTNLSNLGHLILKNNGQDEPEMPGDVCLEEKPLPAFSIGTKVRVEGS